MDDPKCVTRTDRGASMKCTCGLPDSGPTYIEPSTQQRLIDLTLFLKVPDRGRIHRVPPSEGMLDSLW
jgi:hypothetical protein